MLLFTYSISLVIQFSPKDRGKLDGFLHLILLLRLGNAYFERYYSHGWGVVARHFEGFILGGIAEPSKGTYPANLIEQKAFIMALKSATSISYFGVAIEGESMIMINRLHSRGTDLLLLGVHLWEAYK
ncbi:hypothetical protein V6Z12_D08G221800 [Gossypium hirsutum]